jgi:hypothetical protein
MAQFKGTKKIVGGFETGHDFTINEWVGKIGDVPFADLDFCGVTYDQLEPVALIDWKRNAAKGSTRSKHSLEAIRRLAKRASLPFFVVFYSEGQTWFAVHPHNEIAEGFCATSTRYTPRDFVRFMFSLSGREAPAETLERYSDQFPPEVAAEEAATEQWLKDQFRGAK